MAKNKFRIVLWIHSEKLNEPCAIPTNLLNQLDPLELWVCRAFWD
jgi:hypothetical protein